MAFLRPASFQQAVNKVRPLQGRNYPKHFMEHATTLHGDSTIYYRRGTKTGRAESPIRPEPRARRSRHPGSLLPGQGAFVYSTFTRGDASGYELARPSARLYIKRQARAPNYPIFGASRWKKNHVTKRKKSHHDGNFFSSWSEHPSLHDVIFFPP